MIKRIFFSVAILPPHHTSDFISCSRLPWQFAIVGFGTVGGANMTFVIFLYDK
jgi:hypothetical protein